MKKVFFAIVVLILSVTSVTAQLYTPKGENVTRKCIICGYEWEEFEEYSDKYGSWTISTTNVINWDADDNKGEKWNVYLHNNAWMCKHCHRKYDKKFDNELGYLFNKLLQEAITSEKSRAEQVKLDIKIRKQKELLQKLEELKKQIEEVK